MSLNTIFNSFYENLKGVDAYFRNNGSDSRKKFYSYAVTTAAASLVTIGTYQGIRVLTNATGLVLRGGTKAVQVGLGVLAAIRFLNRVSSQTQNLAQLPTVISKKLTSTLVTQLPSGLQPAADIAATAVQNIGRSDVVFKLSALRKSVTRVIAPALEGAPPSMLGAAAGVGAASAFFLKATSPIFAAIGAEYAGEQFAAAFGKERIKERLDRHAIDLGLIAASLQYRRSSSSIAGLISATLTGGAVAGSLAVYRPYALESLYQYLIREAQN